MAKKILHIALQCTANHHDTKLMQLRKLPQCTLGKCQLNHTELMCTPRANITIEVCGFMVEIWNQGVLLKLDS